jgi:hypothetical protein
LRTRGETGPVHSGRAFPERFGFEVDRDEGGRSRFGDAGAGRWFPFGHLGLRVVDLDHPESSRWRPIRERIKPGTENRILVYTGIATHRARFGEPAPAHRFGGCAGRDRVGTMESVAGQEFLGAVAGQVCREGAGEEGRLGIDEQMCRSDGNGLEDVWLVRDALAGNSSRFIP